MITIIDIAVGCIAVMLGVSFILMSSLAWSKEEIKLCDFLETLWIKLDDWSNSTRDTTFLWSNRFRLFSTKLIDYIFQIKTFSMPSYWMASYICLLVVLINFIALFCTYYVRFGNTIAGAPYGHYYLYHFVPFFSGVMITPLSISVPIQWGLLVQLCIASLILVLLIFFSKKTSMLMQNILGTTIYIFILFLLWRSMGTYTYDFTAQQVDTPVNFKEYSPALKFLNFTFFMLAPALFLLYFVRVFRATVMHSQEFYKFIIKIISFWLGTGILYCLCLFFVVVLRETYNDSLLSAIEGGLTFSIPAVIWPYFLLSTSILVANIILLSIMFIATVASRLFYKLGLSKWKLTFSIIGIVLVLYGTGNLSKGIWLKLLPPQWQVLFESFM